MIFKKKKKYIYKALAYSFTLNTVQCFDFSGTGDNSEKTRLRGSHRISTFEGYQAATERSECAHLRDGTQ